MDHGEHHTPPNRPAQTDGRAEHPYYPPRREPLRAARSPEPTRDDDGRPGEEGSRRSSGWLLLPAVALVAISALVLSGIGGDENRAADDAPATDQAQQHVPAVDSEPEITALPPGTPYVEEGSGTYRVVPGVTDRVGAEEAGLFTYTVEIEDSIDTASFGGDDSVARMVDQTLANPRSWTADGEVAFQRVTAEDDPTFRVTLAAPLTVRQFCGYTIEAEVSCFNGLEERTFINVTRWTRGSRAFEGDIGAYRQYVINHEVGHAIGHPEHDPCPADGDPAPIMMQQTLSLRNSDIRALEGPESYAPDDDATCTANGWPFTVGSRNPAWEGPVPDDFVPYLEAGGS